jgi:hypothetical protein
MSLILKTLKEIDLATVSAWTDIQKIFGELLLSVFA